MTSGVDSRALRAARQRAGLTQSELARRIGVAGGERVSRWELGASQPRPDLLVKLAEVLELRPRELVSPESAIPDLRALRLAAGLDAYEVVAAIHMSLPTYRKWEQGRWSRLPTRAVLDALARVFAVSTAEVAKGFHAARHQLRQHTDPAFRQLNSGGS